MKEYPKELLPQPNLRRIESNSVLENGFIREVESDIYPLLEQEAVEPDFFVELIIGNKSSKKEVFELSLFLYGIFNEEHIGIFVNSDYAYIDWNFLDDVPGDIEFNIRERYPLFLKADALYLQNITFLDKNANQEINCVLSYEHRPNLVNYWHFQLFTEENNKRLTRDIGQKKYSRLAKHILETILAKAVCKKSDLKPYVLE